MYSLKDILFAKSVAVIGASGTPAKMGHIILKNLLDGGYEGALYPVNLKEKEILGLACAPALSLIPGPVDLAVVCVPAAHVLGVVKEAGEKGVKGLIVISGGFREIGNRDTEAELVRRAKGYGMRVIGPNCQGVNFTGGKLCATWPLVKGKGVIGIVSQSGTIGAETELLAEQDGIGVSCFAALGNKADVDESDFIDFLAEDTSTKVIGLNIEGLSNPEAFIRSVTKAARKKPVVVLKPGRTKAGAKAAASHTSSIAGNDAVFSAFCAKHGILRADTLTEFYDFCKLAAYMPKPAGNELLVVTSSGGAGILAADTAEERGLVMPPLHGGLKRKLSETLPPQCVLSNPTDLTGDADAARYETVLKLLPRHGTVLAIFGDPIPGAAEVIKKYKDKLSIVVSYLGGGEIQERETRLMQKAGMPVFTAPERAVTALSALLRLKDTQTEQAGSVTASGNPAVKAVGGRRGLFEHEALGLLKSYGIPVPAHVLAKNASDAAEAVIITGVPAVMKIVSGDILHKTENGGVRLGVASAAEAEAAFGEITANAAKNCPGAKIEGVLVVKQMQPGLECIAGVTRDEQLGPALMFGAGGIFAELLNDVSLRLLPISKDDAREMIRETNAARLFNGYRGAALDFEGAADLLFKLSRLAWEHKEIREIDVNPFIVYEKGVMPVDARILLGLEES